MNRSRRLNIPLPPMRPRGERHLSPFYRPAPHLNAFSDPDKDYDKLRSEARQNRGGNPTTADGIIIARSRQCLAVMRRGYRNQKRLGSNHAEAHEKSIDFLLDWLRDR